MDLMDFEEFIDISLINTNKQHENASQKSSQESLAAFLDKMCAGLVENDLVDDLLKGEHEPEIDAEVDFEKSEEMCEAVGSNSALDVSIKDINETEKHTVGNLYEFEHILIDTLVDFEKSGEMCAVGSNSALDVPIKDTDTVGHLNEFEHILAATYISNDCTNKDETDNMVGNETALKEMIQPLVPYDILTDSEEFAETFAECASLGEDKQTTCSLNGAVDHETVVGPVNVADNELENEYNLETAKLNDIHVSCNENISIGNSSNIKTMNTSMDGDDIIILRSESDNSFNSSDFEFISKAEACKQGMVYNTKIKKTMEGNVASTHAPCNTNQPSTSNPHINKASTSEYIKYSKYRYKHCFEEGYNTEKHVIPEGEAYLDMFRGQFAPEIVNNLHTMTNKSVLVATSMGGLSDDLGFRFKDHDLVKHKRRTAEAEETAKKIRAIYPVENKIRGRRRRR